MITTQGEHRGVLDCAINKDRDIRCATTDIDKSHTEVVFIRCQNSFRGSQLLEDDIADVDTGLVAALDDILSACDGPGDNMDPGLKAHAAHAERLLDAVLIVNNELLGQDVNHFPIHRYRQGFGSIDNTPHIFVADFTVLDGNHTLGVDALDMTTGNSCKHRLNLTTGHQFSLLQRLAD